MLGFVEMRRMTILVRQFGSSAMTALAQVRLMAKNARFAPAVGEDIAATTICRTKQSCNLGVCCRRCRSGAGFEPAKFF